jgi:hypothetical protein
MHALQHRCTSQKLPRPNFQTSSSCFHSET